MTDVPPVGDRQQSTRPVATAPAARPPRRRRRRWPAVLLIVLLVLALLGTIAFIVGDRWVRDRAEAQIEQTVGSSLPDGVEGGVVARVDGFSALQQVVTGEFDHVTLRSRDLTVAGASSSAVVELYGVPVDGGPIADATARLTVGQRAFRGLPALQRVNAADPVLGAGTVSTSLVQRVLGLSVTVGVTLTPSLEDQVVHLEPTAATLTAGPATVPATAIVQQLLPDGVDVCAAQYLPQGVRLTRLGVVRGAAQATLQARDLDLDRLDGAATGTCG